MSNFNLLKSTQQRYLPAGIYYLLDIKHSLFERDYYLINNTEDVEINGNLYQAYPFGYVKKAQGDNSPATLTLSNIDQTVTSEIDKVTNNEPVKVTLYTALIEVKDGILFKDFVKAGEFEATDPVITNETIQLSLIFRNSLNINVGKYTFRDKTKFKNIGLA